MDVLDYIEGVDQIPEIEREVIDFKLNAYGEMLCEFALKSSC